MKPVLNDDGTLKNITIRLKNKDRLEPCPAGCGCNVYHQPDDTDENPYQCNSCGTRFICE